MRTANPALTEAAFDVGTSVARDNRMTIQGTVNRTGILLALCAASAAWVWGNFAMTGDAASAQMWMFGGAIGGFIMAMVTIFKRTWSPYTAPMYALLEGLFLGGFSGFMDAAYPGIAIQAIFLTFGTLGGLLLAYTSGMISVTENFRLGVVAATGGIFLVYMSTIVLGFFGVSVPYIHGSGPVGILFSLFVVGIASMNLVLDFDFIENASAAGAPKYLEWYGAFGLMVTLVWLYIEFVRLLAKLRDN